MRNCKLITFRRINTETVFRVLRRISEEEGLKISEEALLTLAQHAHGDLRSALNDLQALSISEAALEGVNERAIATGERDLETDIFEVLKKIFGVEGHDLHEALSALYTLDKTPEESIQWIYKNFSYEYDAERFVHGLHYLSRADMFLGRVRERENFKFWRYASSLMAGGVLSAQEMQSGRREKWEPQRHRYFRPPWLRQPRSSDDRKSAPIREEIAKKVAAYCKVPVSYARFFVIPFLATLFEDEQKAAEITALLGLDVPHITFLVGGTEIEAQERGEKVERIYQDALARAAKKGKEGVPEASVLTGGIEKEELRKTRKAVSVEDEGEDEEGDEPRNQKTLADFF